MSRRITIGFLSTWSVYEGTTIDSYTHALLEGMSAAAREQDCNFLIGCGISLPGSPRASRTAWAVPGADMDFVPVGPWNTDGLIIIPDDLSDAQFDYVQDLLRSGYPLVMTTAEKPGPLVAVDNAGGIRQAFSHLREHGHQRIAFIAGKSGRGGDSGERLAAYRAALREAGLEEDERLIAFGEHRREDGRLAMRRILETGAPFTAVLASNDLSALGAMDVLREAGRRIPQDVAVIGFDDILEGRSHIPPLTTVRHPTFMLGYQAVCSLLQVIRGERDGALNLRVPTQLVIRRSCGCRPEDMPFLASDWSPTLDLEEVKARLASRMAKATLVEVRRVPVNQVEDLCFNLANGLVDSMTQNDATPFRLVLQSLLGWLEEHDEDASAWQAALSVLRRNLPLLSEAGLAHGRTLAESLIDQARLALADSAQRRTTYTLLHHMEQSDRLGLMTSQLLAVSDAGGIAAVLNHHVPNLGIEHAMVALYLAEEDDPYSRSQVLLAVGLAPENIGREFSTRQFPPPELYPDDKAFQAAVLPLLVDEQTNGFAALSATNLELCAAIVHNLASALRTGRLYQQAVQGRQMAEEASRLKSRFLSMVSHELRTPLSLIVGLSEITLRSPLDSTETLRRDLEQIHASAQHLARLIGDVLDLASSEAGQLHILREPLDLTEVLEAVAKIGEPLAQEKGLEWEADIPKQGPWVLGDRTRLRQVVLNLISNAVKFTPRGKVRLAVDVSEQQVVISVSDTGIGVAPQEQEAIFQEFQRSQRVSQAEYGGLGLGLAISKYLVEQHGGRIGVRSPGDFGCGSTFFIMLPLLSVEPTRIRSISARDVVVLAEEAGAAERVCEYLREHGFAVRFYRVSEELDWFSEVIASPPAALILDRQLAERQGLAIAGVLKRQKGTDHIPVLAYSLDEEQNRGELLELNYLPKPLHTEHLVSALERYCRSYSAQRTVLVVDDDPAVLEFHSRLVEQIQARPITARNGREALVLVEKERPDLILLDLVMPEMDGFTVLDILRSRQSTRDIPVIVLTARLLSETELERCSRGVAAVLSKGMFSAAETLQRMEAILTRQPSLGQTTQGLVRRAMACIHRRYADPLSREDIAAEIGISPDYLTDCFRQAMGITPMTYLRRYRIQRACELLENTDLSIMQIALRVGFSDGAHFTRTFQKEMGITPRAYRHGKRR